MKYRNAAKILPDRLLRELQQYVSGEMVYVPSPQSRKSWGERSGARRFYTQRNEEIRLKYEQGVPLPALAEEYALSLETIRRIVYR